MTWSAFRRSPTPSSTASFTTPIASIWPARAGASGRPRPEIDLCATGRPAALGAPRSWTTYRNSFITDLPVDADSVEDLAAAGKPLRPVAILNVAGALDDDVGVRLEQADDLFAGGNGLAMKDATFGLPDDPFDQRAIVAEPGLPERGGDRGRRSRHPRRGLIGPSQVDRVRLINSR